MCGTHTHLSVKNTNTLINCSVFSHVTPQCQVGSQAGNDLEKCQAGNYFRFFVVFRSAACSAALCLVIASFLTLFSFSAFSFFF